MAKKTETNEVELAQEVKITPLEFADLNTIKDKINEIVAKINE